MNTKLSSYAIIMRILTVLWTILGFVPYAALFVLVVLWWDSYYGLPVPNGPIEFGHTIAAVFIPTNLLVIFSLIGSWTSWYILCKIIKMMLIVY